MVKSYSFRPRQLCVWTSNLGILLESQATSPSDLTQSISHVATSIPISHLLIPPTSLLSTLSYLRPLAGLLIYTLTGEPRKKVGSALADNIIFVLAHLMSDIIFLLTV